MDRDEVGFRVEVVDFLDEFDLEGFGAGESDIGVEGEDAHTEGIGAAGDFGADAAHAEDAEGFLVEFDAGVLFPVPFAGFHGAVGLGDIPGEGHEHGESEFGGGYGISAGGIHDHDAVLGSGFDVDIIDADAGAADDLEVGGGFDDCAGDFGFGADDEGGYVLEEGQQFCFRQAFGEDGDFELRAFLESGNTFRRDGVADENVHNQK